MNWCLLGSVALNLERLVLTLKLSLFDSKLGLLEYQQLPFGCLLGSRLMRLHEICVVSKDLFVLSQLLLEVWW
jgi:hypothetical protein